MTGHETSPCRSRKLLVKRAWIRARYHSVLDEDEDLINHHKSLLIGGVFGH